MRWQSEPVIDIHNRQATGPTQIAPPIYVADWWGALFEFDLSPLFAGRITLTWGELSPDHTTIDPNQDSVALAFNVAGGATLRHALPHLGPYLRIDVIAIANKFDLTLRHTNRQEHSADLVNGPLVSINQSVASGATTVIPIPPYVGPAYAFATAPIPAIAITAAIHGHDYASSFDDVLDHIFRSDLASYQQPREIWLPPLINELWLVNPSGAPQTFIATIQPASR